VKSPVGQFKEITPIDKKTFLGIFAQINDFFDCRKQNDSSNESDDTPSGIGFRPLIISAKLVGFGLFLAYVCLRSCKP